MAQPKTAEKAQEAFTLQVAKAISDSNNKQSDDLKNFLRDDMRTDDIRREKEIEARAIQLDTEMRKEILLAIFALGQKVDAVLEILSAKKKTINRGGKVDGEEATDGDAVIQAEKPQTIGPKILGPWFKLQFAANEEFRQQFMSEQLAKEADTTPSVLKATKTPDRVKALALFCWNALSKNPVELEKIRVAYKASPDAAEKK